MCEEDYPPKRDLSPEKEDEIEMHHQYFEDLDEDDREIAASIEKNWGLGCPECGRGEIRIDAKCQIIVRFDELEFAPEDYSYEWDDDSPARCIHCDYCATILAFRI